MRYTVYDFYRAFKSGKKLYIVYQNDKQRIIWASSIIQCVNKFWGWDVETTNIWDYIKSFIRCCKIDIVYFLHLIENKIQEKHMFTKTRKLYRYIVRII